MHMCCLKNDDQIFRNGKVGQVSQQIRCEGAWIHLQQKLKAVAFTRWNFV